MPLKAGTRFDRYEILSPLGAGGMGEVYLARDSKLDRKLALKILPLVYTNDPERVRRFEQEARAVSALNHPNIITVYEVGCFEGAHFIATEFIEGQTLRKRLRQGAISLVETLEIATQITSALQAAHSAGILHRDIKPENIMVRPDGYVKMLDFGLAKLTERYHASGANEKDGKATKTVIEVETDPGVVLGTTTYMSPEQARAQKVDARSDLFSLGIVLYEMIAGISPFHDQSSSDVLAAILQREPAPLIHRYSEVPPELDYVVRKTLAKSANDRYQSAEELGKKLKALRQKLLAERRTNQPANIDQPVLTTAERVDLANRDTLLEQADRETLLEPNDRLTGQLTPATDTSAAHLLTQIRKYRRHNVMALITVSVLAVGLGLSLYFWWHARNTETVFGPVKFTRLTTPGRAAGRVMDAAISPDGNYVAYVADDGERRSLWIKQVTANNNPLQLVAPTELRFRAPTFSHDGNYVYYVLRGVGVSGDLYRVPTIGGAPRKLLAGVSSPVALSPDDRQVAFVREMPDRSASALLVAELSAPGEVPPSNLPPERELRRRHLPEAYAVDGPSWSPDSKSIACATTSFAAGVTQSVVIVNVADGRESVLTTQQWPNIGRVTWMHDGKGLLMSAREPTELSRQVWVISYPSGKVQRLTNDLNDYRGVTVTAAGDSLSSVQINQVSNLWVVPAQAASQAQQVTFGASSDDGVQGLIWSPEGRIIFTSNASGKPDLWRVQSDGSQLQQLTSGAGNNSFPSVSADGSYIVFNSDRSGGVGVWRLDNNGGNPTQLTNGQLDLDPRCSPLEDAVVFSSIRSGKRTLWKVPLLGGLPVPLTENLAEFPVISPDGKWLACSYRNESTGEPSKIVVLPATGGTPTHTYSIPTTPWRLVRWLPDSKGLVYVETNNDISNLWSQPLDPTAAPKQITDFRSGRIFAFDWSRDGKQLALARGLETREIVLISNLK